MRLSQIAYLSDDQMIEQFVNQLTESNLIEEGLKDGLIKGAQKVHGLIKNTKMGYDDAMRKLYAQVVTKLNKSLDQQDQKTLATVVQRAAKKIGVKPLIIMTVVGASMLGADPAAAGDAIDALSNMPDDQLIDAIKPLTDGGEVASQGSQMTGFTDKFYNHVKDMYNQGHNPIELNGKKVTFDQAVKFAEQKTGFSAQQFIEHIGKQNMSTNQAVDEFFRWVHQVNAKNKSV